MMDGLGLSIVMIGVLLLAAGTIWFLVAAFSESIVWGVVILLINPASLVFAIMHWDRARQPTAIYGVGWLVTFLGALITKVF